MNKYNFEKEKSIWRELLQKLNRKNYPKTPKHISIYEIGEMKDRTPVPPWRLRLQTANSVIYL